MRPKDRICVALDVEDKATASRFVNLLKKEVGIFKIGLQLFTKEGPGFVEEMAGSGAKVFLDLKLHDIPNTVLHAAKNFVRMGVFMFNIHAFGGRDMMKATAESVAEEAHKLGVEKPVMLAVTVLTSLDDRMLKDELGVTRPMMDEVRWLAQLSKEAGADGVVASPKETRTIKIACGKDFIVLTPGIRPAGASLGDQKRVTTPREAIEGGSDYIVIGRPIIEAKDPVEAVKKIVAEMGH
ncbi:MAG: orotidine-5'-phosphate decarboxylase [Syntrophobacteraceae bacterium]